MIKPLVFCILIVILSACQTSSVATPPPTLTPTAPLSTSTPIPPTPMPSPYVYTGKVGEYTLTLTCEGKGKPTIILENGSDWISWSSIASFASISQTCQYLRPGMQGEFPKNKRTNMDMVSDLHTLLQQANIAGPYILVGHGYAGYIILPYTDQYPDEVAGLVCVACTHPLIQNTFIEKIKNEYASNPRSKEIIQTVVESYYLFEIDPKAAVVGKENIAFGSNSKSLLDIRSLGNRPFVVLMAETPMASKSHTNKAEHDILHRQAWEIGSEKISKLSTRGRMEVVPNSTIVSIPYNDAVTRAVQEVYDQIIQR